MKEDLLALAKRGAPEARERLIQDYTPFILATAAKVSGRFIRLGEDDEVSIGLLAFNEAIDAYNERRGNSFLKFSELVIKRRLLDFYRHEKRRQKEIPLTVLAAASNADEISESQLIEQLQESFAPAREEELERREEILAFSRCLSKYGIGLSDVAASCPRHRDARRRAIEVARKVAARPDWLAALRKRGSLPLSEIAAEIGVSRKTLERQRKYILAVLLVLSGDFNYLREYFA
ncbi:MAG: RNA polymerase sigma-I factor [Firmicutes bacterium]|jgi:RNA polymerase sigma factor|nr:RNA polymerase sigma-I factor [Bacillota bacterium]